MRKSLRQALESVALNDDAPLEIVDAGISADQLPEDVSEDLQVEADAGQMISDATSSLEAIYDALEETQADGRGAEKATRRIAYQAVVTANMVTGNRTPVVTIESDDNDWHITNLTLESIMTSISNGIKRVIEFIVSLWQRFSGWAKGLLSRAKRTKAEADTAATKVEAVKNSPAKPKVTTIKLRPQTAAYMDLGKHPNLDSFLTELSTVVFRSTTAGLARCQESLQHMVEGVQAAAESKDYTLVRPFDRLQEVPSFFKATDRTSDLNGHKLHHYQSGVMPGGVVLEYVRLDITPEQFAAEMQKNPLQALKLIGTNRISLKPNHADLKLKEDFKLETLDQLHAHTLKIKAVAEEGADAAQRIDAFSAAGEAAIAKLKPIPGLLERAGIKTEQTRLVNESISALRRYLSSLAASEHVLLNYAQLALAAYLNYVNVSVSAYKDGADEPAADAAATA